jgi:two-component system NtrC family response regulator
VDCASIPASLVESTLLGHEKGAFTGADKPHIGLIKQADGGSLFLDEVSEIPLASQKAFLRVLDEGRFRPVGASTEVTSDFRIIAASNRDLHGMVQNETFRKDLLFRIRAFTIELPPLRDRPEDIEGLLGHYVPLLCRRMELATKSISPELVDTALLYGWPGNVRELVNAIERSIVVARAEPVLRPVHLPTYLRAHLARIAVEEKQQLRAVRPPDPGAADRAFPTLQQTRDAAVEQAERKYLIDLLEILGSDLAAACDLSGLSRSRLYALLKKHSIRFPSR